MGSAGANLFEVMAMLMAIELWCLDSEATVVLGDSVGALDEALSMKGRDLHEQPSQVLAVLRCTRNLHVEVGHLPGESNWLADALSRQSGPTKERKPWPFHQSAQVAVERPLRPSELWKFLA